MIMPEARSFGMLRPSVANLCAAEEFQNFPDETEAFADFMTVGGLQGNECVSCGFRLACKLLC